MRNGIVGPEFGRGEDGPPAACEEHDGIVPRGGERNQIEGFFLTGLQVDYVRSVGGCANDGGDEDVTSAFGDLIERAQLVVLSGGNKLSLVFLQVTHPKLPLDNLLRVDGGCDKEEMSPIDAEIA
jgi:hypothetical protein